jgi:hypothetical protein
LEKFPTAEKEEGLLRVIRKKAEALPSVTYSSSAGSAGMSLDLPLL